jgi:hypothetical protein
MRAAVLGLGVALLVVAAATLPVSRVVLAETDRSAGTERRTSLGVLPYTFFAYAVGFSLGPTVDALHALPSPLEIVTQFPSVTLVFAAFVPVALAGARRLGVGSRAAAVVWPWLVGPPLGVFALSQVSNIVYNVRYALASLPAFFVLIAAGCLGFPSRLRRVGATAAVASCVLASLARFYWDDTYDRAHVRDALAYIRAADPGAPRVIVAGEVVRAVDYYARAWGITLLAGCEPQDDTASGSLWLLAGRDWNDSASRCLATLAARYRPADHHRFVGIEVLRLEIASRDPRT